MKESILGALFVCFAVCATAQTVPRLDDASTNSGQAHHALGQRFLDQNNVNGAIRELRQAAVLLPDVGRVHYDYGRALVADGDTDEAVKEFKTAIHLGPDDPDPHVALAAILTRAASTRGAAIAEYRAALRLNPDSAEARRGLGNALVMTQLIEMVQALAKVGGNANDQRSVQDLFASSQQTRSGLTELRKAIELSPRWAEPHHDLAIALKLFGDHPGALSEYQLACRLEPENEKFCADYRNAQSAR